MGTYMQLGFVTNVSVARLLAFTCEKNLIKKKKK